MNTTSPVRAEPVYGHAVLPRKARVTELPPAPRVVQVDDHFLIQHPVHGKFLVSLFARWAHIPTSPT